LIFSFQQLGDTIHESMVIMSNLLYQLAALLLKPDLG